MGFGRMFGATHPIDVRHGATFGVRYKNKARQMKQWAMGFGCGMMMDDVG